MSCKWKVFHMYISKWPPKKIFSWKKSCRFGMTGKYMMTEYSFLGNLSFKTKDLKSLFSFLRVRPGHAHTAQPPTLLFPPCSHRFIMYRKMQNRHWQSQWWRVCRGHQVCLYKVLWCMSCVWGCAALTCKALWVFPFKRVC